MSRRLGEKMRGGEINLDAGKGGSVPIFDLSPI